MRKILVTAISGNVSNSILKILEKTEDEIFGCDVYNYPVGMDQVKLYWTSEWAADSDYIDNLLERCRKNQITHIIPVNESEISVIDKNRERFINAGIKLLINSSEIICTFMDKALTAKRLDQIPSICVPRTFFYDDFVEDGKSYIAKYRQSCGSKFLRRITYKSELENVKDKENLIIQEYIPDEENEYTVGVYSNGIKVETIIFKRKLQNGYTSFVELVLDDSIKKDAITIAKEIHLKGAINLQLRKYMGKNYIFEINPRISGTVGFRHQLNFNDLLWWLDLIDGKYDYNYDKKYTKAIGIRELNEKFLELE